MAFPLHAYGFHAARSTSDRHSPSGRGQCIVENFDGGSGEYLHEAGISAESSSSVKNDVVPEMVRATG
ncbi:hypothetical protein D3C75_1305230 [compost metagenome]